MDYFRRVNSAMTAKVYICLFVSLCRSVRLFGFRLTVNGGRFGITVVICMVSQIIAVKIPSPMVTPVILVVPFKLDVVSFAAIRPSTVGGGE